MNYNEIYSAILVHHSEFLGNFQFNYVIWFISNNEKINFENKIIDKNFHKMILMANSYNFFMPATFSLF